MVTRTVYSFTCDLHAFLDLLLMTRRIGIDTGGTFTDLVIFDSSTRRAQPREDSSKGKLLMTNHQWTAVDEDANNLS